MDTKAYFIYLAIMALTTYLVRVIPLVMVKEKIRSRFLSSFLYYIPFAVLTAMTIPAIFTASATPVAALVGLTVAVVLAVRGFKLTSVALISCAAVYVTEIIIRNI